MPRGCNCSGTCGCVIVSGDGASVTGAGRADNPYKIGLASSGPSGDGGWDPGDIKTTARSSPAPGWLVCNGAAVARATYPALFDAIGEAYGRGDGATTFNLPDWTKRFIMGAGGDYARGTAGGTTVMTPDNLPVHTHPIDHNHAAVDTSSDGSHDHNIQISEELGTAGSARRGSTKNDPLGGPIANAGQHTHSVDLPKFTGTSGNAGAPVPADFLPPFSTALVVIKT